MGTGRSGRLLKVLHAESASLWLGPDKPVPIFCVVRMSKSLRVKVGQLHSEEHAQNGAPFALIAPGERSHFSPV